MQYRTLDVELLSELREHTRTFAKLDLAYLAAAFAFVTALRLGSSDTLSLLGNSSLQVTIFIAVGLVDAIAYSIVFDDWLAARIGVGRRISRRLIVWLTRSQPLLHTLFILSVVAYIHGYSRGYSSSKMQHKAMVILQDLYEAQMLESGSPPITFEKIKTSHAYNTLVQPYLDIDSAKIEVTGPSKYKITFPGMDGISGTSDDDVITQDVKLRNIFDAIHEQKPPSSAK